MNDRYYESYYDRYYDDIPGKGAPWVLLILTSIIALVSAFFWLPFYRACQAYNHDVMKALKDYTVVAVKFGAFALAFFVFSIITNVKFSRCAKFYGPSFGNIFGRIIVFLEYATYAFAIIALFIA